jgi:ornithine cyclodeaminase/alanine dehydrogenase-like protein (mu-crystallin family)
MSRLSVLDAAAVRAALPATRAVAALRAGLAAPAPPGAPRTATAWRGGELLTMPAEAGDVAGVKLVTVRPAAAPGAPRVQGVYVLFDAATLTPLLVADAAELTLVRTAALSALATDLLAPAGASRVAVVGTGPQAREHVRALCAVRDVSAVTVVGRSPDRAAALAAELAAELDVPASAGGTADLAAADVVCTCTTSPTPVLTGRDVSESVHVNAIGSHRPGDREVSADFVASCALVAVDDEDAARREAGDLVLAVAEGAVGEDVFGLGLPRLLARPAARPAGRTLFKSVGFALADLLVARELLG